MERVLLAPAPSVAGSGAEAEAHLCMLQCSLDGVASPLLPPSPCPLNAVCCCNQMAVCSCHAAIPPPLAAGTAGEALRLSSMPPLPGANDPGAGASVETTSGPGVEGTEPCCCNRCRCCFTLAGSTGEGKAASLSPLAAVSA